MLERIVSSSLLILLVLIVRALGKSRLSCRAGSVVRLDGKWSTLRVSGTPEQFQIVSFTGR